jgi:polyhydroxyalkanoate synthesis regulator phasin
MKDDALSPSGYLMETLPIAAPDDKIRVEVESIASRSIELTKANQSSYRDIYDWLQLEHQIEKLGRKLEDFSSLSLEEFVQEIKKRKPKDRQTLNPQSLKEIKAAYQEYAPQIQTRKAEILQLEHQLSDLVNRAYQLTPAEIELMWRTAPPRMPITRK